MRMLIVAFGAILFCGCNGEFLKIDPALAAPLVEKAAAITTALGLKALASDAETHTKMKEPVRAVRDVIEGAVIPLLRKTPLDEMTRAAADKALALLNEKVPVEIKAAIQIAVNGALSLVEMPENPAERLEPGQAAIILALFGGIRIGADTFLAWGGPGTKDLDAILEITWSGGRGP